ncbi:MULTISPECIES: TIGR03619 family F420-dependent LLM class oxidoreductase [unclassified Rhodococcus (in: high G+C Gram-positive bacteria)]|uniref:TIGR03619 family F420-dependent LLM class oxidoreductase n=1 Tax=unclassified Rhodococcus (in: high G+C Gram-positive bacteria) TaxID=192944 RepID=UPI0009272CCE|nr:TIGR03619 family F420-dependent LLM class oxidoreductase [Rhodococcus sp. M8]OLL19004.1 LLM class F420-dependent oxidoreductase [Rhodococcus sp. M8]QPG47696.1 TIGR03619 family F420-dependent LLM class oxidoreductase [Rhodococcus sp. M8]
MNFLPPTLSVNLPNFGDVLARDNFAHLVDVAVRAEECGVDRVNVTDHVVMGADTSGYAWGPFATEPDAMWLEPMTVLAVIAGRTRTIRLGTGVIIAALRGAAVLAKTAATLDHMSGGRLDLGVGTGWQEKEYEAAGLSFADRGPLLDDTLAACRALWEHAPASVQRPSVAFTDVYCAPRPGGRRIPVWVSGSLSKPVIRRLARWGDGWIPIMGAGPDELRRGRDLLRGALERDGRDPDVLQIRGRLQVVHDSAGEIAVPATAQAVKELLAVGVTDVMVPLTLVNPDPDRAADRLATLVTVLREAAL